MLKVNFSSEIFIDALIVDSNGIMLFMSAWGRDTAAQEMLARMTLPGHEQGISSYVARSGPVTHGGQSRFMVTLPNLNVLEKQQARVKSKVFGDLVNIFIYSECVARPSKSTRIAWALYRDDIEPDLWPLVVETCHLPLLNHWEREVMSELNSRGWINRLSGYNVSATSIDLSNDDLEKVIETMIADGRLNIEE